MSLALTNTTGAPGRMEPRRWHILTGEYPPQPGGVSDYTRSVACGLAAAGDDVTVWAPQTKGSYPTDDGVAVCRLAGTFGPTALAELERALARRPGRVLVQYVPQAFGWNSMNVPLCVWLWRHRQVVDVMFHEVAFPFEAGQPLKHHLLAVVHRGMASLLVRGADRVFVSIPGWEPVLRKLACQFPQPIWLPVPSNVPAAPARQRAGFPSPKLLPEHGSWLVGHFGTYGCSITRLLEFALIDLFRRSEDAIAVLLGRGGPAFAKRLTQAYPNLAGRMVAPGDLDGQMLAAYLARCDVLLQPYPDGISSRRGSAMAGLSLGLPIVTTDGVLTEPLWHASGAVVMAAVCELAATLLALRDDPERRQALGTRAAALYRARFAIEHTIRALRNGVGAKQTSSATVANAC